MPWEKSGGLPDLLDRALSLRLRAERVKLAHKTKVVASVLKHAGVDVSKLQHLNATLIQMPKDASPKEVDLDILSPPKTGVWRKRYLTVVPKPGSVF